MDSPAVLAVDNTPEAVAVRFAETLANISLLFGGRNKPYPTPQTAVRHRKSFTVAAPGNSASEPKPRQKITTPTVEICVGLKRFDKLPASGAQIATATGHGVKIKADSSTE